MENITLYDADNLKSYDILLSVEDARRASTDMTFAAALLKAAIADEKNNLVEEHNQQEGETNRDGETNSDDDSESSVYRWSQASVMLLIHSYQEMKTKFIDGKNSHKKCWEVIAKKLNNEGHKVTGAQCSSKLRSLKKTYKAIKDYNTKSGNDRRTWQYLEIMDELFGKNAWCEPVAVASSSGLSDKRVDADPGVQSSTDNNNNRKNVIQLMKRRLEQKEAHEDNKKKRHDEKMALDQKLLEVLQKLAEK